MSSLKLLQNHVHGTFAFTLQIVRLTIAMDTQFNIKVKDFISPKFHSKKDP
jgi:hypothetical protein